MRISQKVNPFGFDRYIVEKIFKRNNQIIEIKTYYFNQLDYFRKYIIKENKNTPNPPMEFFANPKVKWWGWDLTACLSGVIANATVTEKGSWP